MVQPISDRLTECVNGRPIEWPKYLIRDSFSGTMKVAMYRCCRDHNRYRADSLCAHQSRRARASPPSTDGQLAR